MNYIQLKLNPIYFQRNRWSVPVLCLLRVLRAIPHHVARHLEVRIFLIVARLGLAWASPFKINVVIINLNAIIVYSIVKLINQQRCIRTPSLRQILSNKKIDSSEIKFFFSILIVKLIEPGLWSSRCLLCSSWCGFCWDSITIRQLWVQN